jgi:hypothetical protein
VAARGNANDNEIALCSSCSGPEFRALALRWSKFIHTSSKTMLAFDAALARDADFSLCIVPRMSIGMYRRSQEPNSVMCCCENVATAMGSKELLWQLVKLSFELK